NQQGEIDPEKDNKRRDALCDAEGDCARDDVGGDEQKSDSTVELIKEKMSPYSRNDLKDMEVGILVYRDGDGALQALSVEGNHTNVDMSSLYGEARQLGATEYVAEFHSHPTRGGSYSMSPDDVRIANA